MKIHSFFLGIYIIDEEDEALHSREILLHLRSNEVIEMHAHNQNYLSLAYTLLFPSGIQGWYREMYSPSFKKISASAYFAYYSMVRKRNKNYIPHTKKLFDQFLIDAYVLIENENIK